MVDTFAIRVKMLEKSMTISDLSRKIGKSPATIGRWLKSGDMPVCDAEKIALILGLDTEEMIKIFFAEKVS